MTQNATGWCASIGGRRASAVPNVTAPRWLVTAMMTRNGIGNAIGCKQCRSRFDDLTGTVPARHRQLLRIWEAVPLLPGPQPVEPADHPGTESERGRYPGHDRTVALQPRRRGSGRE